MWGACLLNCFLCTDISCNILETFSAHEIGKDWDWYKYLKTVIFESPALTFLPDICVPNNPTKKKKIVIIFQERKKEKKEKYFVKGKWKM